MPRLMPIAVFALALVGSIVRRRPSTAGPDTRRRPRRPQLTFTASKGVSGAIRAIASLPLTGNAWLPHRARTLIAE